MKKYRCPNCGEECLSWHDRCYGARSKSYFSKNHGICHECNRGFIAKYREPLITSLFVLGLTILFLLVLLLFIWFQNIYGFLLLFLYTIVIGVLAIVNSPFSAIIQYDEDTGCIMPIPNGKVTIHQATGRIRNLDIFGIKFCQATKNVKFNEAFTNQLVPVVFHIQNEVTNHPIRVTIIKREFVPAELLYEGSRFIVIDNGKEIATGVISYVSA